MQLFKNNAYSTLGAALTNVATTMTVATGQGDRFPVVAAPDFMMVTLQDAANNIEIVKVTARAAGADSMTIVRAQEGTTARAWSLGDIVELRLTEFGLGPLEVLAGANTEAAIRLALNVPTRTGGDASGTWGISITGNAATATSATTAAALATPRAINGTNFDGSAAITTANWGTARTITLGATGKSVNGSENVSWTLAEIGAAAASATVNLTGDQTISGAKTFENPLIRGASPTLYFRDTDGASAMIHCNANILYVLRGDVDSTTWSQVNGQWPMTLNLSNNNATFGGDVWATGNVTAYSDERLKEAWNEGILWTHDFIQRLAYVKAGTYTRKDTGERQIGVSAQALREVMPEAVLENKEGTLSVAYGNAALAACVALAREVVQLRQRIEVLEAR